MRNSRNGIGSGVDLPSPIIEAFLRMLVRWVVMAGVAVVLVLPVSLRRVRGASMEPSLVDGSVVVTVRRAPTAQLRRGEIFIVRSPWGAGELIVKRAVGLAGDCVPLGATVGGGEPRQVALPCREVAEGHAFIAGDNLSLSEDSRRHGSVHTALFVERVVAVVWPLSLFGTLPER